jgi:hypothetical protein
MVNLPKNCKVIYGETGVFVKMVYATSLPTGVHDGVTVFKSPNSRKNYFELNYHVAYQNNLPMKVKDAYYEHKKKAMLFNRMKKVDMLKQEIDILSNSNYAGKWDIEHLRQENQLTNSTEQLYLFV